MAKSVPEQLSLLDWTPPRQIIVFPLTHRVGRIREVASKVAVKSQAQADFYCRQVTEGLMGQLERLGLGDSEIDEHVGAFWSKVRDEMNRQAVHARGDHNPKGAA